MLRNTVLRMTRTLAANAGREIKNNLGSKHCEWLCQYVCVRTMQPGVPKHRPVFNSGCASPARYCCRNGQYTALPCQDSKLDGASPRSDAAWRMRVIPGQGGEAEFGSSFLKQTDFCERLRALRMWQSPPRCPSGMLGSNACPVAGNLLTEQARWSGF